MEKMVIHIGYHKSASTYLQEAIFPNMNVNYIFLAGEEREILNMVESKTEFDKEKLHKWINTKIKSNSGKKVTETTIVSHEELSGHPHGYKDLIDPYVIADNLKKAYPSAKILIIIRNQFDYLLSIYTYRVAIRGYEYRSFNRFIKEEEKKGLIEKLEYHKLVSYYISLFSAENVHIIPMELLKFEPDLFHKQIGDILNEECKKPEKRHVVNESTKFTAILTFWRIGNFFFALLIMLLKGLHIKTDPASPYFSLRYRYFKFKKIITRFLNKLFSSSHKITINRYRDFTSLQMQLAKSNQELQKKVPFDLKSLQYPMPKSEKE